MLRNPSYPWTAVVLAACLPFAAFAVEVGPAKAPAAEGAAKAPPAAETVTQEILDLALVPPIVQTNPGPEYSDAARDYAMTIGIERTRRGRLWAAWVGGGDSDKGFFVVASSDDDGRTWSHPRLVIDPPEAPTGLRRERRRPG